MKQDEFAFFNRQLATMLQEGIPLEGAIRRLCEGMRAGTLRSELEKLERELAQGAPLEEALLHRQLPPLYRRMLELGARANDLPGVLTLLADHYERTQTLWMRLKGLMVYPALVIAVSIGITIFLSFVFNHFLSTIVSVTQTVPPVSIIAVWAPPIVLTVFAALCLLALSNPNWRAKLRWRLPGFREASVSQVASAMALMLRNGTPLADALALGQELETESPAGQALGHWKKQVEAGEGDPAQWTEARPFPPLFLWLVRQSGEDAAAGFEKAAEIYHARASYRIEMALYGALPVAILLLGQMVFWQAAPMLRTLIWFMNLLGGVGEIG